MEEGQRVTVVRGILLQRRNRLSLFRRDGSFLTQDDPGKIETAKEHDCFSQRFRGPPLFLSTVFYIRSNLRIDGKLIAPDVLQTFSGKIRE